MTNEIANTVNELKAEIRRLRRRANREAAGWEECHRKALVMQEERDDWTYTADGVPPPDEYLELTILLPGDDEPCITFGRWHECDEDECSSFWVDDIYGTTRYGDEVVAWKLAPKPAPLRPMAERSEAGS